jgi:hypothetical protein
MFGMDVVARENETRIAGGHDFIPAESPPPTATALGRIGLDINNCPKTRPTQLLSPCPPSSNPAMVAHSAVFYDTS